MEDVDNLACSGSGSLIVHTGSIARSLEWLDWTGWLAWPYYVHVLSSQRLLGHVWLLPSRICSLEDGPYVRRQEMWMSNVYSYLISPVSYSSASGESYVGRVEYLRGLGRVQRAQSSWS